MLCLTAPSTSFQSFLLCSGCFDHALVHWNYFLKNENYYKQLRSFFFSYRFLEWIFISGVSSDHTSDIYLVRVLLWEKFVCGSFFFSYQSLELIFISGVKSGSYFERNTFLVFNLRKLSLLYFITFLVFLFRSWKTTTSMSRRHQ